MSVNCIIVDDEPLARALLEDHISNTPGLTLVASCENALAADTFLKNNKIDLMFLDIELPLLKGNNFLKGLKVPPAVIITTAYREYAVEGYELDVVDYLLKPITFERFFNSVQKLDKHIPDKKDNSIFVSSGNKHIRILLTEILLIESFKDYITIHFEHSDNISVKYNISSFQKLLNDNFLRVHRSFIINKEKVTSFSKNSIWVGSVEIPIGDSFRKEWTAFSAYMLAKQNRNIGRKQE